MSKDEVGALLRSLYDRVAKEPVPDFLTRVLEEASKDFARESGQ